MTEITKYNDVIDSRDIIERIDELEDIAIELPDDVEVFEHDGIRTSDDDCWADADGEPLGAGWYYWSCQPGCMPEGGPNGPFETEEEAEADALENFGSKLSGDEQEELEALKALAADGENSTEDWKYGATLIRDSYFKEYAQELAEDIGAIDRNAAWPNTCIDWDQAARELKMDYTSVEFQGVTYWVR